MPGRLLLPVCLALAWAAAVGGAARGREGGQPGGQTAVADRDPMTVVVPAPPTEVIRRDPRGDDPRLQALAQRYRSWLAEVDVLIADEEREAFLELGEDYERDAFIREFWRSRDPYPDTARNELRDRYQGWLAQAGQLFASLYDQRARAWLYLGPPAARYEVSCGGVLWPVEAWFYTHSERYGGELALLFYRKWGVSHWRLWSGQEGVAEAFYRSGSAGGSTVGCNYEKFRLALALIAKMGLDYLVLTAEVEDPPQPDASEWVATFASYSTDAPPGAETFAAELALSYPGWHGQRTVVQGVLKVPVTEVAAAELGGGRSYSFSLNGEVLRGEELFERFRYKFDVPAAGVAGGSIPLIFQRYLRPGGPYRLILLLEDLTSGAVTRSEEEIHVPRAASTAPPPRPPDPETARLLAAANAAIARGEASLAIVQPVGTLQTGLVRFDTLTVGGRVDRVVFSLDGEPLLTKREPPFSVELDLGELPQVHTLRAAALDASGEEIASDEILINSGGHRFAVRFIDPVPGRTYRGSLRARMAVEVPEGERLDRLELYLGEQRLATLYGPPFEQPVLLPPGEGPALVRAVGYLAGEGGMAEDVVWVNAPGVTDVVDVQLVELYTSVFDRQRRPVEGLTRDDFTVREDGQVQEIRRFEPLRDLPFRAAILLDVSASMEERLEAAKRAALGFFRQAVTPRDRLALVTFNDRPNLAVPFTRDVRQLGGGLAGLKAERSTALYDSLIFSLFYFNGVSGQRALVVLSDGKDEGSRYGFEEALEYARRAGVTLYAVGLDLPRRDGGARRRLARLAEETGGRAFFLATVDELPAVYDTIQRELRSRYLLAYQSSNTRREGRFRRVEVEVDRRGLEAATIQGYYP